VNNTGPTAIGGDIGAGSSSITGFPPGIYTGTNFIAGQVSTPLEDAQRAYGTLAALNPTGQLTGDLGGTTLGPGTYSFSSSATLTGKLTLAGTGSSSDAWYFQIGSTLITASSSQVVLTGGAVACNVFWQVGTSATVASRSSFVGNIIAAISVTLDSGAVSNGAIVSLGGSVSLTSNIVRTGRC
jgi:hypothetical protein